MTLGKKIENFRNEKKIRREALASILKVSLEELTSWENDETQPDMEALKKIAFLMGCTVASLISDSDVLENQPVNVASQNNSAPQTIIIHEKEAHVCEYCHKDISEDELEVRQICVRGYTRGHRAVYRQGFYHKKCLEEKAKLEALAIKKAKEEHAEHYATLCFVWGGIAGGLALVISLLIFLLIPQCQKVLNPFVSVILSLLIGYGFFSMLYCIISGSYIGEVFVWCATRSIKFPMLIFSWDLDGFVWVICMKILFAICSVIFGIFTLCFGIAASAVLGAVSFPFILADNIKNGYENAGF